MTHVGFFSVRFSKPHHYSTQIWKCQQILDGGVRLESCGPHVYIKGVAPTQSTSLCGIQHVQVGLPIDQFVDTV